MKTSLVMWVLFVFLLFNAVTARVKRELNPESQPPQWSPDMPDCTANQDCPADRMCVSQQCKDPCLKVCGNNTICQVTDHIPVCMCYPGFIGNPVEGCQNPGMLECISNEGCAVDRMCIFQRCTDPCPTFCGDNTTCQVTKHFPVCSCQTGFIGNPVEGCRKPGIDDCITNEDCPDDKACISLRCKDPCLNFCGNNTVCHMSKHYPVCSCLSGYIGNPMEGCNKSDHPCNNTGSAVITEGNRKMKYYMVTSQKLNWGQASAYCQRRNHWLAIVTTKEGNDEIHSTIKQAGSYNAWIGGTDMATEGDWTWVSTGQRIEGYTNWRAGMPDNWRNDEHCLEYWAQGEDIKWNDEHCLEYWAQGEDIKWNDVVCSSPRYFICEY